MSKISKTWHGILREEIPWYPTVNEEKCIGCGLCFVTCGRDVYEMADKKAKVINPYNCMVGCTTCETVCPVGAITFPSKEMIQRIEKEYAVLRYVQKEKEIKGTKLALSKARAKAEKIVSESSHRANFTVAGHILENDIPEKLVNLVLQCSCDIVDLQLETPSLKACFDEKAPSVAKFTLVSQEFKDISECTKKISKLLENNGIVIVEQKKIS
ncbi:MAG: ferredoxin family protein [Caldisericaceae bacterium]|nr:ferredoxin family protein [Caldisericaceae bacterium]